MKYQFKVGELVRVQPNDIGLVTARRPSSTISGQLPEYTILIGGIPYLLWEYELTKVSENNEL